MLFNEYEKQETNLAVTAFNDLYRGFITFHSPLHHFGIVLIYRNFKNYINIATLTNKVVRLTSQQPRPTQTVMMENVPVIAEWDSPLIHFILSYLLSNSNWIVCNRDRRKNACHIVR